ncbi:ABC transporter permease [Ostreibacterium oceani]|uniref:ABC transporter permease subunit n=1 Tax=Ostreibacterium oceani TaxID=2654998 RepID=A0A6N7ETD9_9GAMM|nr:ABC transporter permease subunit [Ostreibacterium oceani]MPV86094.1 ABC transporter permease subunit [Ostreibacterium oceani]
MQSIDVISQWLPTLLKGASLSLLVALTALLISLVLGMLIALSRLSDSRILNGLGLAYTTIIRGIPELVLLLLIFYGGQQFINDTRFAWADKNGVDVSAIDFSPFWAGAIIIGLIYTAYMAETFRGAILAVPSGQREAANAYGLSRLRIFWRIILPQMTRHALPGISNNWLVMLKATALVSLISLQDVVKLSADAAKATGYQFTFYLFAGVVFLCFTTLSIIVFRYLERHYSIGYIRSS